MAIANVAFEATQSGTVAPTRLKSAIVSPLTLGAVPIDPNDAHPQAICYVIWGRVVIRSLDGSTQNASAQLMARPGGTNQIDRVDFRTAEDASTRDLSQSDGQTVSLLARLELPPFSPGNAVQISRAPYDGVAQEAPLIAMVGRVDLACIRP
jgi:hypothetical protein